MTDTSDDTVFEYTGKGQIVPDDVVSVQFHSSVVEVENDAFRNCKQLKSAFLNDGLKKIGRAFLGCSSLQSIKLPSTVTEIGERAFAKCSSLSEVVLNEGLKQIGYGAFASCASLGRITIPSTVFEIGKHAFNSCLYLRVVVLHEGVSIGKCAFAYCSSFEMLSFPSISTRLDNIVRAGHYPRIEAKIDKVRGAVERRGSDMFLPVEAMKMPRRTNIGNFGASIANFDWKPIKDSLDKIVRRIRYYEVTETTTLLELALWKFNIDRDDNKQENHEACRIDVPGPVKETILQYLCHWSELGPTIQEQLEQLINEEHTGKRRKLRSGRQLD